MKIHLLHHGVYFHLSVVTVRLKCNLIPTRGSPGENVRVNLQMSAGKGLGVRNVLHQPGVNLWRLFRYKLLRYISTHHYNIMSYPCCIIIHSSLY